MNGTPITEFQPQNNKQAYLAYLCGAGNALPTPRSVEEVLLYNLCMNGGTGGGGSNDPNGKPIIVPTSEEMDDILANATDENVGTFYIYIGETTDAYVNGSVYSIQKEDS